MDAITFGGTKRPSITSPVDPVMRGNDAGRGGYMRRDSVRTASMYGSLLGFLAERGVISLSL